MRKLLFFATIVLACFILSACESPGPRTSSGIQSSPGETTLSSPAETLPEQESNQPEDTDAEIKAEKDFRVIPDVSEVYPCLTTERRAGTKQELGKLVSELDSLNADDVLVFTADYIPSDFTGTYILYKHDLEALLTRIKAVGISLLPEEEYDENPALGGRTSFYIETEDIKLHLYYTGWIAVCYHDLGLSLVFKEGDYTGPEPGPSEYIYQIQQGNVMLKDSD